MVSDLNILVWKWSEIAAQKKVIFADLTLQNMVETTLPDGLETSGKRAYRQFWHISRCFLSFCNMDDFFPFFKKNVFFFCIPGPLGNQASRWIRDLLLKGVSLILAYF